MRSSGTRQLSNAISVRKIGKDYLQKPNIEKFSEYRGELKCMWR